MNVANRAFSHLPPAVRLSVLHALGRYAPWESKFDFTPPSLNQDETTGVPEFVGIGVQKAGTTWWFELIASHPMVSTRPDIHKERHFFDRFGSLDCKATDLEMYAGWFPRRVGSISGEWTPDYFGYPWVPSLLKAAAPDTRLLVLLRDPVERFFSGLAHLERMGKPRDTELVADAVERGYYLRALQSWLESFDRSQVLILQYERCVVDPVGQLTTTFNFLGLETQDAARLAGGAKESRSPVRPVMSGELRSRLVKLYAPSVSALVDEFSEIDLSLWPNFAYLSN